MKFLLLWILRYLTSPPLLDSIVTHKNTSHPLVLESRGEDECRVLSLAWLVLSLGNLDLSGLG